MNICIDAIIAALQQLEKSAVDLNGLYVIVKKVAESIDND